MIANLVSFALRQRFLIVIASLALMLWGAVSFQIGRASCRERG